MAWRIRVDIGDTALCGPALPHEDLADGFR
jgi:hypothetical protein